MSSAEFTDWLLFYEQEPWGCEVEDIRNAMLCQVSAALGGNKHSLKDFMPQWQPPKQLSFEEGIKLLAIRTGWNGSDNCKI